MATTAETIRWLASWHLSMCWNHKGERTFEFHAGPILYDLRVGGAVSLGLVAVGWWRWATDDDFLFDP